MKNTIVMANLLLLLLLSNPGYADIMRCETGRVVSRGDTAADVLTRCGEPTQQASRRECPKPRPGKSRTDRQRAFHETDCVTVDTWAYDLGPRRLVHTLIFKNNRLETIQTSGYGQ